MGWCAIFKSKIDIQYKGGNVGQDFIEELCKQLGLRIEFPVSQTGSRATQNPWDIKIENKTFELKTATEDTTNSFQFNHIRYHRKYDAVLCLGISLEQIFFGVWSKADVVTGDAGKLVTMEKGANASYKLTKGKRDLQTITEFDSIMRSFLTS